MSMVHDKLSVLLAAGRRVGDGEHVLVQLHRAHLRHPRYVPAPPLSLACSTHAVVEASH